MHIFRKHSLIKKILIPILALAIFLMPISPSIEKKSEVVTVKFTTNKALAVDLETHFLPFPSLSITDRTSTSINFKTEINVKYAGTPENPTPEGSDPTMSSYWKSYGDYSAIEGNGIDSTQGIFFDIKNETKGEKFKSFSLYDLKARLDLTKVKNAISATIVGLEPKTKYSIQVRIEEDGSPDTYTSTKNYDKNQNLFTFLTPEKEENEPPPPSESSATVDASGEGELDLNCSIINLSGCIAELFYLLFQIVAFIGKLAGRFLDFFIYYSTDSGSYLNGFVTKGWSAIRDVANMFFIIALLYIAIKTILGLEHSTKKMLGHIVIFALLINFSLFFTRVIIDSSNILAKVFYNNIEVKNQDEQESFIKEKSISVALVSKFNPQNIVSSKVYNGKHGTAMFIFVTILAIAIVLYAAYIFFSVGLLFVSRVAMLWISMIFAPIAFASYTLPFDIPGIGHKDWWDELLKNAFLAPIFIFFLYIITMFANILNEIVTYPEGVDPDTMQTIMGVIVPFAILMILLMKAKELAVKYAGEMGKMVSKVGAFTGGAAVGLAAGGAGIFGRATFGRWGSMMGNSEKLKEMESKGGLKGFMAARLRDTGSAAGKGSFDIRGAKIAGKGLASTGLQVGSAQAGGFEKRRADQVAKRQRRAASLKIGEDSKVKQELNAIDADLHGLESAMGKEMEAVDKLIEKKRNEANDAERELRLATASGDSAKEASARVELEKKNNQLKEAKERKSALAKGEKYSYIDDSGKEQTQEAYLSHSGKNFLQLEQEKKEKTRKMSKEEHHRMESYAKSQASGTSQTIDFIISGGQHSFRGAREASYKIRTGASAPAKEKKGHDSHGGGGHTNEHKEEHKTEHKTEHKEEHGHPPKAH